MQAGGQGVAPALQPVQGVAPPAELLEPTAHEQDDGDRAQDRCQRGDRPVLKIVAGQDEDQGREHPDRGKQQ